MGNCVSCGVTDVQLPPLAGSEIGNTKHHTILALHASSARVSPSSPLLLPLAFLAYHFSCYSVILLPFFIDFLRNTQPAEAVIVADALLVFAVFSFWLFLHLGTSLFS